VSPRKSSTSSGRSTLRPRYLGVEVVGEPFVPRPWLEAALARALTDPTLPGPSPRVRVIRSERGWALVEIEHAWLAAARHAWNGPIVGPTGRRVAVATHRTWGTLKDGKIWLRNRPAVPTAPAAG
jgi:hypothetical protein